MIHLVVGTPMYGGMCSSEYTESLLALKEACVVNEVKLTTIFTGNESLIQRARNNIAHHFLSYPDATHLLFIDADQKFRVDDIVKMLKADKEIIAGPVPMKAINWKSVREAAKNNHPDLSRVTGHFNLNTLEGHKMQDGDTPFQVKHIGTGFMLIKREVFENMKEEAGWYAERKVLTVAKPDKIHNFFKVENVNNELLSEDYFFCYAHRKLGGTVWAAPWCQIGHFGAYIFSGQYAYQNEVENGASSNKVSIDSRRYSA